LIFAKFASGGKYQYFTQKRGVYAPLALFCEKEKIPERGIERSSDFKDLLTPPQGALSASKQP
jgi:hypothetical protein